MIPRRSRTVRLTLALAAAMAGGSLCGTCEMRFKDALIGGATGYLSTLLDPTAIVDLVLGGEAGSTESTGG